MNSLFKAVILACALAFAGGQAASAFDLEHLLREVSVGRAGEPMIVLTGHF